MSNKLNGTTDLNSSAVWTAAARQWRRLYQHAYVKGAAKSEHWALTISGGYV